MHGSLMRRYLALPLALGTLLFAWLSLPANSEAGEGPKFVLEQLLEVRAPRLKLRANETRKWSIIRIAPYGKNHYLALLQDRFFRWDPWVDKEKLKKEARKQGVVASYVPDINSKLKLVVINKHGKVIDVGENAGEHAGYATTCCSTPLLMDADPSCPFAVLDSGARKLSCFDYDLGFLRAYDMPLDEIGSARVTYDGSKYTVWIFGRGYGALSGERELMKHPKVGSLLSGDAPAKMPAILGARFYPEDGSIEPLPVDIDDLVARLERIAKGPEGEKLKLQKASIRLAAFDDPGNSEPFWVLIEAVSAKEYKSRTTFSGTRLFFRAKLDPQGFGKIEQLSMWMLQNKQWESRRLNYDEKTGVFKFGEYVWLGNLGAVSLGKKDFLLALLPRFGPHEEIPAGGVVRSGARVYLYFSDAKRPPVMVENGSFRLGDGTRVRLHGFSGVAKEGVVAFWATHYLKGGKKRKCLALMRLETE